MQHWLSLAKRERPFIIDGGLATELQAQGHDISGPLWSARLLQENPQAIVRAHRAYINAGANIIISASYQASIPGLEASGTSAQGSRRLIQKAGELAREAVNESHKNNANCRVLVAGSVGPFGAYRHDGSEYTGRYGVDKEELRRFHRERLEIIAASPVDLLAAETIPCLDEARAILAESASHSKWTGWISFSCRNERELSSGEKIEDAATLLAVAQDRWAIGINCTHPFYVTPLVTRIRAVAPKLPIVLYPNRGDRWVQESQSWVSSAEEKPFSTMVEEWLSFHPVAIGGCCRVGPPDIEQICHVVEAQKLQ